MTHDEEKKRNEEGFQVRIDLQNQRPLLLRDINIKCFFLKSVNPYVLICNSKTPIFLNVTH